MMSHAIPPLLGVFSCSSLLRDFGDCSATPIPGFDRAPIRDSVGGGEACGSSHKAANQYLRSIAPVSLASSALDRCWPCQECTLSTEWRSKRACSKSSLSFTSSRSVEKTHDRRRARGSAEAVDDGGLRLWDLSLAIGRVSEVADAMVSYLLKTPESGSFTGTSWLRPPPRKSASPAHA